MSLLPLPIPATVANTAILTPAFKRLPTNMDSTRARIQLLATALQESNLGARRQANDGPAKGLWQFERGGGCKGVVTHLAVRVYTSRLCAEDGVEFSAAGVWNELETDDVFAACIARLLYWTDPMPLPAIGDESAAWGLYLRTWRPGAYTNGNPDQQRKIRAKWAGYYAQACRALDAA